MAITEAHARRQARKEELRAYLAERGRVDYILNNIEKIENLDVDSSTFNKEITKLKTANEQRIKLLSKYLPDMKDDGESDSEPQAITINLVKPDADS